MAALHKANALRGSLSEQAYHAIRRMILTGELPPGVPLSRRAVAEQLGIGLVPVSEAFQRLEYDGLLESWPRIGTRVRVPSPQDVRGTYVIREALESQSARLFAEKASAAEKQELMSFAVQVDRMHADAGVDYFEYFNVHARFHRRIAECTGCPALVEAVEKTNVLVRTWQFAALSRYRGEPANHHQRLMQVLNAGDPEAADRAMREHVRIGMDEVVRRMEPFFQGAFEWPPLSELGAGIVKKKGGTGRRLRS